MPDFLVEAKKAFWKNGRRATPAFLSQVEALLLEKLASLGEIEDTDREWARETALRTFGHRVEHDTTEK